MNKKELVCSGKCFIFVLGKLVYEYMNIVFVIVKKLIYDKIELTLIQTRAD